jgi:hypothetical protein
MGRAMMKRCLRSLSQNHHRWLALLMALAAAACAPVTLREAWPTEPIRATNARTSVEVRWAGTRDGAFAMAVRVKAAAGARLERAALVQASAPYQRCSDQQAACDAVDSRFTTGTSARVVGDGPDYLLLFPSFGAQRELAENPRLLLDIAAETTHTPLELDLSRATFESGSWGMGGAIRYRPAGVLARRVEHMVSGELGAERWLGATRLHLGYEIGFGYCCSLPKGLVAADEDGQLLVPMGGQLSATHYARLDAKVTLGLGIGYEALWLLPSERPPDVPAMLHGPRLRLQLVETTPRIARFADEPPKLAAGPELAFELLFEDRFEHPRLAPSLALAYWVTF